MKSELPQPDRDRVSALTALVLLTYTLIRIVVLPPVETEFVLLGLVLRIEFNTRFVMLSLAAALAAAGSDWLIQSHPKVDTGLVRAKHWVIPGLAALGSGAILTRLPEGFTLWIGLALTAILLIAVLMAEFIVIDPTDPRHDMASISLTALAYLLLIGVFFTIRALDMRAAFAIPLILFVAAIVAWRLLRLDQLGRSAIRYASLIGAITAQIAWALHYWPWPPLRGAMILGLTVYLGNGMSLTHYEKKVERKRILEFMTLAVIALLAILTLG